MKNASMDKVFGQHVSEILIQYIDDIPKGNAIDIGCAGGANSIYLKEQGFKTTGVDLKLPSGIKSTDKCQFVEKDIMEFGFTENHFSLVLTLNVLQFLPYSKKYLLLEDMIKSLTPGGYILLESFTIDDPGYKRSIERGANEVEPNSFYFKCHDQYRSYFAKQELEEWLYKQPVKIVVYKEEIVDDDHPPGGPHQHGLITFIGMKE